MLKVKFFCNLELDHTAPMCELIETDTVYFHNKEKAVEFLLECTKPITKLAEIGCNSKVIKKIGKKQIAL